MHFWSKFGKPHFIWYWLIARTNSQAKNGVNFDFQVQFDLEDHRQSPHKTIGILIKVFYISDPNLVILAWTADELLHGQADDWRTDTRTHTHTHTQATTIPEGQNWPRVKSFCHLIKRAIMSWNRHKSPSMLITNISNHMLPARASHVFQHTEAELRWSLFSKRCLQTHFCERKYFHLIQCHCYL